MDKQEFLELYNKWHSSFIFSAHGSADPAAKEHYNKLKEWCENNRSNALQYIREILMEEPNDIVYLLADLFNEEFGFTYEGFCSLVEYCNLWLIVTDTEFDNKHIKDYYKDWKAWHEYLKENYISWNPLKEQDPNVTFEEFKQGKRNDKTLLKEKRNVT